jgi:PBP1b-binding outer membrane lipoprotein LpoB
MKKILFTLAISGLLFTACSDEKKEGKENDKSKTEQNKESEEDLRKAYEEEFNNAIDETKGDIELTDSTEVY